MASLNLQHTPLILCAAAHSPLLLSCCLRPKTNPPPLMSHMCTPTRMNAHLHTFTHQWLFLSAPPSLPQGAEVLHQLLNWLSRLGG